MTISERIGQLRAWMAAQGIAAYWVPTADPHNNEYIPARWMAREWLTGFTGSAGLAVVTPSQAGLWTDSRYWLQAGEQLDGSPFALMREGSADVPSPEAWLAQALRAEGLPLEVAGPADMLTAATAEALEAAGIHFDAVVSIEIDDAVIEARMTGRRVCGSCGASFHIVANPPKVDGVCDLCGAALTVRKDDAPETVKNRLKVFHAETEPLKDFYKKLGNLKLVEGNQPIENATRDILAALGE